LSAQAPFSNHEVLFAAEKVSFARFTELREVLAWRRRLEHFLQLGHREEALFEALDFPFIYNGLIRQQTR
jgi:hypothetical protein